MSVFTLSGKNTEVNQGIFSLQQVYNKQVSKVWAIIPPAIPTYELIESSSTINEASSVSFAVNTTNLSDGTTLYWTIQNISSAGASLFPQGTSGTVIINNNTGNVAINTTNVTDSRFSGPISSYIFALQLRTESTEGTIVSTSNQINVNNTWAARVYTTSGSHSFTVPPGVTKISYAVIGGGGGGGVGSENFGAGGGGACAYRNNVTVTSGQNVIVFVGAGGAGAPSTLLNSSSSGDFGSTGQTSYVEVSGVRTNAGGGQGGVGNSGQSNGGTISGTYTGGGAGGKGGAKLAAGGGGAGGFTGAGGNGARWWSPAVNATAGSGGGGGGGGSGRVNTTTSSSARGGFGGGGGAQTNGTAGPNTTVIGSGNNGSSGSNTFASAGAGAGAFGGNTGASVSGASGGTGAVMIIWDGNSRQWPSTNIIPFG